MKKQKKSLLQGLLKMPRNTSLKPYTTRMAKKFIGDQTQKTCIYQKPKTYLSLLYIVDSLLKNQSKKYFPRSILSMTDF